MSGGGALLFSSGLQRWTDVLGAAEIDLINGLFNGLVRGAYVPGRHVRFGAASLIPERQFTRSLRIIRRDTESIAVVRCESHTEGIV